MGWSRLRFRSPRTGVDQCDALRRGRHATLALLPTGERAVGRGVALALLAQLAREPNLLLHELGAHVRPGLVEDDDLGVQHVVDDLPDQRVVRGVTPRPLARHRVDLVAQQLHQLLTPVVVVLEADETALGVEDAGDPTLHRTTLVTGEGEALLGGVESRHWYALPDQ